MNKLLIVLCIFSIISYSCTNTSPAKVENPPKLKVFLDNFLTENPNCLDNEIMRKECGEKLATEFLTTLEDSILCITEIPVKYDMLLKQTDSTYIVKFLCGQYTTDLKLSENYELSFEVYSLVSKETATLLKEKEYYYIKGKCSSYADSKTFPLPSGKRYQRYPYISKSSSITKPNNPSFDLGVLVVENLAFTSTK